MGVVRCTKRRRAWCDESAPHGVRCTVLSQPLQRSTHRRCSRPSSRQYDRQYRKQYNRQYNQQYTCAPRTPWPAPPPRPAPGPSRSARARLRSPRAPLRHAPSPRGTPGMWEQRDTGTDSDTGSNLVEPAGISMKCQAGWPVRSTSKSA